MNTKKDLNIFLQSKKKKAYLKNGWVRIPKLSIKSPRQYFKNRVSKFLKNDIIMIIKMLIFYLILTIKNSSYIS